MAEQKSKAVKLAEGQLARVQDYKKTFSSQHGKAVLRDLMSNHFMMRPTVVTGDPQLTAFHEGQRNVVLRIFTMLEQDQNALAERVEQMTKETNEYV